MKNHMFRIFGEDRRVDADVIEPITHRVGHSNIAASRKEEQVD